MKTEPIPESDFEIERYELDEAPIYRFDVDRRAFFKTLGSGVVVLFLVEASLAQESGRRGRGGGRPSEISAWLHIGEDGAVKAFTGKAEVGQNIRTSLTQAVAEELHTPVNSIEMIMADTDLTPYDRGTFGSRTTPDMNSRLRRVAAVARETLLDLGAEFFETDRGSLVAEEGKIKLKGSDRSVSFGELTQGRELTKSVSDDAETKAPSDWKTAGTSVPKVNGRDFVSGRYRYTSDVTLPEMVHGKVLRPAAFDAELTSLDTSAAEAISGVTVVRDGNFVGLTAPTPHVAERALQALQAEWQTTSQPSASELFKHLKENASEERRRSWRGGGRSAGSMETGLAEADHKLESQYTIAYIAHAPLEPRAAVANWEGSKLTVWTGSQRPFGVRGELARAFDISEERVRVIVPDTGSGYGGKHTGEAAIEAARLAKAAKKPVKLVWTREEEFTWAYFRPAGVIDIHSGVRNDGRITAWEFHNYNSGGSAIETPYDVPNQEIQFHSTRSPLRQGSYRALASTANNFARESHVDDLAHSVGMDPLEFRLKNLSNDRLRAVFEAAAKAIGWENAKSGNGRGFGIGGGIEKGSYVATCAEVETDLESGSVKVVRVTAAFECGAVVNPTHLENQVEGSVVMGLGGALFEAIDFADGKILNPRFSNYRVPRFSDTPPIEIVLVNRPNLPSEGAGETPIIGIAPAIGNAIRAATGIRLRSLPMVPNGLKQSAGA